MLDQTDLFPFADRLHSEASEGKTERDSIRLALKVAEGLCRFAQAISCGENPRSPLSFVAADIDHQIVANEVLTMKISNCASKASWTGLIALKAFLATEYKLVVKNFENEDICKMSEPVLKKIRFRMEEICERGESVAATMAETSPALDDYLAEQFGQVKKLNFDLNRPLIKTLALLRPETHKIPVPRQG